MLSLLHGSLSPFVDFYALERLSCWVGVRQTTAFVRQLFTPRSVEAAPGGFCQEHHRLCAAALRLDAPQIEPCPGQEGNSVLLLLLLVEPSGHQPRRGSTGGRFTAWMG